MTTTAQLSAQDLMTRDVMTVSPSTTVGHAMSMMRSLGVRHLPVLGDGRFLGLIDDRLVALSLLEAEGLSDARDNAVGAAMTHYVPQVAPGASVQRVAHLLTSSGCDALVVIDGLGHLLGIITMVDLVKAVARTGDDAPSPTDSADWPPFRAAPSARGRRERS